MTARCEAITRWLHAHEGEVIAFLEALVNQDSGTCDRVAVNRVADHLAGAYAELGCSVLINSDEEIGSPTSRQMFLEVAHRHQAAMVPEPARPNGECVIGRKGVGHFHLEVASLRQSAALLALFMETWYDGFQPQ